MKVLFGKWIVKEKLGDGADGRFGQQLRALDRIERVQMGLRAEEKVRQEKNRRQKRRRSKKAQNKDLFEKHRQTEKKISDVSKRAKLKE